MPFSFVLWGSSIPIFYAEAAIRRGSQRGLRIGLIENTKKNAEEVLRKVAEKLRDQTLHTVLKY